jgi:hypothetical protein
MEVLNKINLGQNCSNRSLSQVYMTIVHRIDCGKNATEIADFFNKNPEWTGGKMAYHFIISPEGVVEQAIPLSKIGPAALKANVGGIQIGCIGDFRKHPPTDAQKQALLQLLVDLNTYFGKVNVWGHDEIPGGSKDKVKKCPGSFMYSYLLRDYVAKNLTTADLKNLEALKKKGYTI